MAAPCVDRPPAPPPPVSVASPDPREDFPAWLGAHGVSPRVLESLEAELGIGDYEALLACAAHAPVRAELLAAAKDRLPFAFYAALRRVAEQVGRGFADDGGRDGYAAGGAGEGSFYQSLFSSLLGAIVVMLNNLSCELLRSAERFTSLERLVNAGGGGAAGVGGEAEDAGEEAGLTPCSTDETEESMDEHKYDAEDDGGEEGASHAAEPGRMGDDPYPDEAEGYAEAYAEGYGDGPYGRSPKTHAEHGPRHVPRVKHEPHEGFSEEDDAGAACPASEPGHRWQRRAAARPAGHARAAKKRGRSPAEDGGAAAAMQHGGHHHLHHHHLQQHGVGFGGGSGHAEAPLNGQHGDGFAKAEGGHGEELDQGDCAADAASHTNHGEPPHPHLFTGLRFPHKLLNHHYAGGGDADQSPSSSLQQQHRSLACGDPDSGAGGSPPAPAPGDDAGAAGDLLWPALDDYGKLYQCDDCGKGFLNRSYLYVHRRKHTGERPYGCDVCGRRFSVTYNLARHKKTHTGEKPFVCRECGLAFRLKHHLLRHEKKHSLAPDDAEGMAPDGPMDGGAPASGDGEEGARGGTEGMMYEVPHLHPTG